MIQSNDPERIVKTVKEYLLKHKADFEGFHVNVREEQPSFEDDLWYVRVMTDEVPGKQLTYYDNLWQVADDIKRNEQINVVIVPSGVDS